MRDCNREMDGSASWGVQRAKGKGKGGEIKKQLLCALIAGVEAKGGASCCVCVRACLARSPHASLPGLHHSCRVQKQVLYSIGRMLRSSRRLSFFGSLASIGLVQLSGSVSASDPSSFLPACHETSDSRVMHRHQLVRTVGTHTHTTLQLDS